jgi:hypothetical protein
MRWPWTNPIDWISAMLRKILHRHPFNYLETLGELLGKNLEQLPLGRYTIFIVFRRGPIMAIGKWLGVQVWEKLFVLYLCKSKFLGRQFYGNLNMQLADAGIDVFANNL